MKIDIKNFNCKPALILGIITAVTTLLLMAANHIVEIHAEDENIIGGKLLEKCTELMGEGNYEVLDWPEKPKSVLKHITSDKGDVAFQVLVRGYNKDGLNILVSMNPDGSVKDLVVVENKETKGIGDKIEDRGFLDLFIGRKEVKVVKSNPKEENEIAAVTTATKSSVGVADAVNAAVKAYETIYFT